MADKTLGKYGVPLNGRRAMMKQPKRKDHFRIVLRGFGGEGDNIALETNTIALPSVSYEKHEVNSYNSKMHYKGKYTWNEMELSVRDTIDNGPLIAILKQWKREFNHETQESRVSAGKYKFELLIQILDGSNSTETTGVLSGWYCEGCMMTTVNFGDGLDYGDSNFSNITVTIQPDNCTPIDASEKSLAGDEDGSFLAEAWKVLSGGNIGLG